MYSPFASLHSTPSIFTFTFDFCQRTFAASLFTLALAVEYGYNESVKLSHFAPRAARRRQYHLRVRLFHFFCPLAYLSRTVSALRIKTPVSGLVRVRSRASSTDTRVLLVLRFLLL